LWSERGRRIVASSGLHDYLERHHSIRLARGQSANNDSISTPFRRTPVALTLQEIFAQTNDPAFVYSVLATLVITQEDGRTGFLQSRIGALTNPSRLQNGQMDMIFSDRNRFGGNSDNVGLTVQALNANTCRVDVLLNTWNSAYNLTLTLPANFGAVGKVYQGYGDSIGAGTGRGLHCLSFDQFVREPPPIT
jgi:hypothetical protein